jgi:phosphohistidine phosphatase
MCIAAEERVTGQLNCSPSQKDLMRFILFRHGPAGRRDPSLWPDDALRPLTRRGEERTRRAAQGLGRIERGITLILTSPFRRADGTAQVLARVLGVDRVERLDALAPGGSPRKLLDSVPQIEGAVVLVGHEPDLGQLGAQLIGSIPLPLKKAGACAIAFDGQLAPGAGTLLWLATPKLLRRLALKKDKV